MGDDLFNIFWEEARDYLDLLNDALLRVEMSDVAERQALLREMNRIAHSLKGAARTVGFGMVETIAHYMEEIFHQALHNQRVLTPDIADSLYDGLDLIQQSMNGQVSEAELMAEALARLEQIVAQGGDQAQDAAPTAPRHIPASKTAKRRTDSEELSALGVPASPAPDGSVQELPDQLDALQRESEPPPAPTPRVLGLMSVSDHQAQTMVMRAPEESLRVSVEKLDQLMADASELLVAKMQIDDRQTRLNDLRRLQARWAREWRSIRAAYIRLARRLQEDAASAPPEWAIVMRFLENNQRYLAQTSRELAQLAQMTAQANLQLATLSERLQEDVADLRMMPFETLVGGLQRLVRDTARDLGKQATLEVVGAQVEVDKTVLEALKDPLLHLVRNALDHGLETPQQRALTDKPSTGRITLLVEQRGNEILIRVSDDGRGIDPKRLRRKAIERQLLSEAEAQALSDDEARQLIFTSGFSTASEVTTISGRGLGLDIVRGRVEALRGRVSVESQVGHGTSITLRVPVSLTRLRCVLLRQGSETLAVPSVLVARMETISRQQVYSAEGRDMLTLGQKPVPLANLGALLGLPNLRDGLRHAETLVIMALQSVDRTVAFEVDDLLSETELVLKPLGAELAGLPLVVGAALLGTGEVILVLDANDLVRRALGEAPRTRERIIAQEARAARRLRVLVVDDSITTRTLEKNILEAVGFEVHVAIDGVEGWSRVLEVLPDVVVSDVEMPHMNGLELTRRIKGDPRTQAIPVVLLTSLSKPEQREEGLKAGADAYLVKSRFDQRELLETIQGVL
ncbi:MAG: hybrid sensor histidine kinase/response regulator [Anaerolineae bacterium]|nr:hybrid sensor histidine kinase/response regulator [Anaerolineae bacterium]MDW8171869.1 hybrid sensor histidine kinase/response regulator [Anaerolineae bacterium]